MNGSRQILMLLSLGTLLLFAPLCNATDARVGGEVISKRDIEAALAPRPSAAAPAAEVPRTRGIVIKAAAEEKKEVIDLNVPFELGSAVLQPQALGQLQQLEAALNSAGLRGSRFRVAGHTDGRGDAEYNRRLSVQRAEAVRDYLLSHGVSARRLVAEGFGKERLLLPQDPGNPANRRVEITNLGEAR